MNDRPNANRFTGCGGRTILILAVIYCGLAGLWAGCTREQSYRTLTVFFDGVPDPNAPVPREGEAESVTAGGVKVVTYTHKPFREQKCQSCHTAGATADFDDFTKLPSSICLKCHQDKTTQYPVMHGPVAAAQCLWCHNPHESSVAHLLRNSPAITCGQCHEKELLSANPPEHRAEKSDCLQCHVAHGGPAHKMLRSVAVVATAAAPTAPATAPTTLPAHGGAQ